MQTETIEKTQTTADKKLIKILHIEDDEIDRLTVRRILSGCSRPIDFDVDSAGSLSEGIEYIGGTEYDTILLDLGLPDSNSVDSISSVRGLSPSTPIVVLTGADNEEIGLSAMEKGAADYLVKGPSLKDSLVRTILYALERRKTAQKIEQAAKEWRTTFDSITDMVSIHDTNFRILRVNRALADVFGMEPKDFIGRACYEVFHNTKEPCRDCPHHQTLETGKPATNEFFEPKLGIHLGVSTFPIFDENGEIKASVHLTKNITRRKEVEEKLKKANEKLREYNQLKSDFVSTASHELRTPLAIIEGAIKLVLDEITGKIVEEQREVLTMAIKNTTRLSKIVKFLLDVSRIESGKIELQTELADICKIVKDTISDYEPLAEEKDICLDCEIPQSSIDIHLDPDRTRQVLINLISNSIKFTPEGGRINVTCAEQDGEVLISVQDSGRGIAEENIPKLFDKFTQFGRKAISGEKGTGLGLAISKGIVELWNGRIWAESELGKGSKFTFTLPK